MPSPGPEGYRPGAGGPCVRDQAFRPPVTLRGAHVTLVPLEARYRDAYVEAGRDPEVHRYLFNPPGRTPEEVAEYIATLLRRQAEGTDLPFSVQRNPGHRIVGGARFLHIDRAQGSAEIGTWLDSEVWRTPVNTEIKFLLLRFAFEGEGAHRIALQTDLRNERSQRAISRLGATREGVLREDRVAPGGHRRSSVVYSILADEWPSVRRRLERELARPWPAGSVPVP
jgi:RimJ/RimL family protein N-acetyltransferase